MVAVTFLPENRVKEIGAAIDHQMLFGEVEAGVYTSKNLDHPQPVQCAVRVPDRSKNLLSTVTRSLITFLDTQPGAQLPLQIAYMS